MSEKRYYVDDRIGCCAVRDRTLVCAEVGLWEESSGVIRYWSKRKIAEVCPTCGYKSWHWPEGGCGSELAEAKTLAEKLNTEASDT